MGGDSTAPAIALARHLIQRVPFEAKPVLLAVQEAAEIATAGRGLGASTRRSGKRKRVSGRGEGAGGIEAVASLLKLARTAMQSPLLPLPVPVSSPPSHSERSDRGETSSARVLSVGGEPKDLAVGDGDGEATNAPPASVTAELLLSAFVRSPAAVRRSVREAMQQG